MFTSDKYDMIKLFYSSDTVQTFKFVLTKRPKSIFDPLLKVKAHLWRQKWNLI